MELRRPTWSAVAFALATACAAADGDGAVRAEPNADAATEDGLPLNDPEQDGKPIDLDSLDPGPGGGKGDTVVVTADLGGWRYAETHLWEETIAGGYAWVPSGRNGSALDVFARIETERPSYEACDVALAEAVGTEDRIEGCETYGLEQWRRFIRHVKPRYERFAAAAAMGRPDLAQLRQLLRDVNDFAHRWRYRADEGDEWLTPGQFLAHQGDCEDYSIFKYVTLRELGASADDLRILVGWIGSGQGHAVLVSRIGGQTWYLDNLVPGIYTDGDAALKIVPAYAFNEFGGFSFAAPKPKEFIGAGCAIHDDCGESECAHRNPDGLCTESCEQFCPDRDGQPETFCADLGDAGFCVSRCRIDADCRAGYACQPATRRNDRSVQRRVCLPHGGFVRP